MEYVPITLWVQEDQYDTLYENARIAKIPIPTYIRRAIKHYLAYEENHKEANEVLSAVDDFYSKRSE